MLSPTRAIAVAVAVALACVQAAAAKPVTRTYSSGNLNVAIEDAVSLGPAVILGLTSVELPIADHGTIVDANLRLRMGHARDTYPVLHGIFLDAPGEDGFVFLSTVMADFGSGPADCSGTPGVLDDEATTPLLGASPPFVGPYRPEAPLSGLDGLDIAGTWELGFWDLVPSTPGSLYCFELEITYEPPPTDLSLHGADTPDPVRAGQSLRYTLTARNDGPSPATGVTVVDRLPAGAAFVSAQSTQGECARTGRRLTCDVGELASGASARVTVVVRAPRKPGRIVSTATVSSDVEDTDAADNRVQLRTTVRKAT
jgi:uncharacterized repeat protein (TIGR01451 family)